MRILSLELRAFGPFRDVALDFSGPAAVHVVYGPNEAGKSTALRAITGLLYGIPHLSPDAHTHRAEDLRIAGRLASASGAELAIVRRKGRVRTLLDAAGDPLPEPALLPFLGGIGEEVFRAAFGLDHETLRLGAQALLEGRGHLGESLFGAGLGGTGIPAVLASLRKEADDLYSPLARTKKLNLAIRAVVDAKKRAQSAALPAGAWLTQEQAIREGHAERARLDEEAHRLRADERRLRRARTLLGLLAQLRTARAARAALAGVPLLPDDAAGERTLAEAEIADAAAQIRRAEETLARLAEQRDALSIPHALVAQADAVEDLSTRLGSHRKASVDLPRVRAELRAQEEEALEIVRHLGLAPPASATDLASLRAQVDALRVDVAREERIRALARDAPALVERARQGEEDLKRSQAGLLAVGSRAGVLPKPRDVASLRRAEARAKALGDVAAALDKSARAAALLEERAAALRAALGLAAVPLPDLPRLPVPLAETVDTFATEERALRSARSTLDSRAAEARTTLTRIDAALAAVAAADLPTEADLVATRSARAAALRAARSALAARDVDAALCALSDLESAALTADRIADRLRAEADRVAHRARLVAERASAEAALAAAERDTEAHASLTSAFDERWRALWSPCAVPPRSPDEMRGWLRKHEALVALVDQSAAARAEHEALHARAAACAEELAAALAADDPSVDLSWPPDPLHQQVSGPVLAPETAPSASQWTCSDPRIHSTGKSVDLSRPPDPLHRQVGGPVLAPGSTPPAVPVALPATPAAPAAALPALLDAAERELSLLAEAERAGLALASAQATHDDAARRLTAHRAALADWQREWEAAIAGLPVRPGASPGEVLRVLDTLGRLFGKLDDTRRTARRVDGMERDARELTRRVAALAREHAPELEARPPEAAAVELVRRFHQARVDLEKLDVLRQQLLAAQDALGEQRARAARAAARIDAMRAAARAATTEDLVRIEGLSAEAKRLDRRIELLSEQLRAAGDNAPQDELEREASAFGADVDALGARIEEIDERLAENARERSAVDRDIGASTQGLAKLREGNDAEGAALDLEAAVAETRTLVLTYARSRAAALVLEREIEAYKRRHQGPIVSRAGELFRALTLGSFAGLSTGFGEGDQTTLRCVREGGREVDVEGLSDGTRDQLYLALRLASLERFAAHAEPLPLVLDDAFVHFDDDRAREALLALAALSPAIQVLFFTHHDRLVSLAESALANGRSRIHHLARAPRRESALRM